MMKARYGRIVNVSSVGGHIGTAGQANYAAAKAGLVGLTRSVARELARRNITCNVVAPGPIVTAMTDDMPAEWRAQAEAAVPLGRFGTAEECARGDRVLVLGCRRLRHRRAGARRRRPRHGPLTTNRLHRSTRGGITMDRSDALSTMKEVAAEVLSVDPDQVTEEARFKEDLDADSLDLVELIMGLEERFDITVPEEDLEGVTTVGQALDLVIAKVGDVSRAWVTDGIGSPGPRRVSRSRASASRPPRATTSTTFWRHLRSGRSAAARAHAHRPVRRSPCSSAARSRDFDPTAYLGAEGIAAARPGDAARLRGRGRRARRRGRREHRPGPLRSRRSAPASAGSSRSRTRYRSYLQKGPSGSARSSCR